MTTHLCIHGDVFTRTQRIVDWIASRTSWPIVTDRDLIEAASRRFDYPAGRLEHCMKTPDGIVSRLTHGTARSMAYLRSVLADTLEKETTILHGTMGLLSPPSPPRMMKVLVTADRRFRVQRALSTTSANERQVNKIIARRDRREFKWCRQVFGGDRFDADAYDLVVPSDRLDRASAGRMILERLVRIEMRAQRDAAERLADFKLASEVQVMLCESGHPVSVAAENGRIRLTVERPVLRLNRLTRKLERQVRRVEGVRQVETRPGEGFFQADIYRRCRFEMPTAMAFRSFSQYRRRLYDGAAEGLPADSRPRVRQESTQAVQRPASTPSP